MTRLTRTQLEHIDWIRLDLKLARAALEPIDPTARDTDNALAALDNAEARLDLLTEETRRAGAARVADQAVVDDLSVALGDSVRATWDATVASAVPNAQRPPHPREG